MTNIQKIAIVGPESSGKTTLAEALAQRFETNWVPEFARAYVAGLDHPYQQKDLYIMARGQLALEVAKSASARQLLFCDTNLLVIKIWSEEAYGEVSPRLAALIDLQAYPLYLLMVPDIPWTPDPLREHPDLKARQYLFRRYEAALKEAMLPYVLIQGAGEERTQMAIRAIDSLLRSPH